MHVRTVLAVLKQAVAEGTDAYGLACRIADAAVEEHALLAEAAGANIVAVAIRARLSQTPARARYRCATCDLGVLVIGQAIIRGCEHTDAAVVGDMEAEAQGNGGLIDP